MNNNYYTNLSVKHQLQNTAAALRGVLKEAYPALSLCEERFGLTAAES